MLAYGHALWVGNPEALSRRCTGFRSGWGGEERVSRDDQVLLEIGGLYFLTFISVIYCCVNVVSFGTAPFREPRIVYMILKSTLL